MWHLFIDCWCGDDRSNWISLSQIIRLTIDVRLEIKQKNILFRQMEWQRMCSFVDVQWRAGKENGSDRSQINYLEIALCQFERWSDGCWRHIPIQQRREQDKWRAIDSARSENIYLFDEYLKMARRCGTTWPMPFDGNADLSWYRCRDECGDGWRSKEGDREQHRYIHEPWAGEGTTTVLCIKCLKNFSRAARVETIWI